MYRIGCKVTIFIDELTIPEQYGLAYPIEAVRLNNKNMSIKSFNKKNKVN
jgi:hypothetical protein